MKERVIAYLSGRCPPILRRFSREENGANMVIFAVGLMVLMGFSGIAVDGGNVYYQQQRMQIAADAAALGGARALANGQGESAVNAEIESLALANGADLVEWEYINNGRGVHVECEHIFDSYFARLYGYDTFTVTGDADAQYEPISATDNLFPMTFSCNCIDGGESTYPDEGTGDGGDDQGGGSCPLLPIAMFEDTALNAEPGAYLPDIYNGIQPGNFGWLSWIGSTNAPSLEESLILPGTSDQYINPDTGEQFPFSLENHTSLKVMGLPGVTNSSGVRNAMDALIDQDVMVPLWRTTAFSGANAYYEIVGFAIVNLLDYNLPHKWISARFIAIVDSCADYQPGFSTVTMGDPTTARYDISLLSRTDDSSGGETWTYKVSKLWGNDLYSWGIELLPSCDGNFVNIVDDDMGTASIVDNYLSWNLPPGFTEGEFSFTVDTRYVAAPVNVSAADTDGYTYGTLAGPNCDYPTGSSTSLVITNPDEDDDSSGLGVCMPSLDFESDDSGGSLGRGDRIDNEWTAWGVHVTSNDPVNHPVMIFDSSNPTGGDSDLGTPNWDFGGPGVGDGGRRYRPGQNDQALGNILIISEDGDENDPDDNANGGTMIFTFDLAVRMDDVYVVDTDSDEAGGEVRAYSDLEGTTLLASNKGLGLGDNSVQAIPINAIGVRRLEIDLPSSGGVPAIVSCRNQDNNLFSIGDKVWDDENANGLQDEGEPGIADVVMELRVDGMSQLVSETTTDASGRYQFANLPEGSYKVTVSPDNWGWGGVLEDAVFTTKDAGDDTLDSDFDSSSKSVIVSVPKNGGNNLDVDAGFSVTDSSDCDACTCGWPYFDCGDETAPESVTISFRDWHKKSTYSIEWVETVGNTWTYRVSEGKGNDLTYWSLGIDNCLDHIDGYSPGGAEIGLDYATWFSGIKWNVSSSFEEGEFSFTLDGNYDTRTVMALAKASYDHGTAGIVGPDCSAPIEEEDPIDDGGGDDGGSVVEQDGEVCQFRWLDWDGGTTSNLELQQYMSNTELSGQWRIGDEVSRGPVVSNSTLIDSVLSDRNGDELVIPLTEWNGVGYVVCGFAEVHLVDHDLSTNPIQLSVELLQGLRRASDTDPDITDYGSRDIIMLD